MSLKTPTCQTIALWRYELLEEVLGEDIRPKERGPLLRRISRTPVHWPSGKSARIALATLYRWLCAYRRHGLDGLKPKPRKDKGARRRKVREVIVQEGLRLLEKDPEISLTFLIAALEAKFPEAIPLPKSTLQRRLAQTPEYKRVKRLHSQRRTRFVAKRSHDIWQCDAKGPFSVLLASGQRLFVHVLSILDDATRAVMAARVVASPNLGAAVRVFRLAALRWGLPQRLYADRASIFDSISFRAGLATLGVHRIWTKARNPPAHGKIEAYHRTLSLWFVKRLPAQVVVDFTHLQLLLDGLLAKLYQPHRHRGLKQSPEAALANAVSLRSISPTRLTEAFLQEKVLKAHPKTGEVDISKMTYLVPDEVRGQKLTFFVDPAGQVPPQLLHPVSALLLELRPALIRPENKNTNTNPAQEEKERWGEGPLQAIYDSWRGQRRPIAEPGFGLPELYQLLSGLTKRHVPNSEMEAAFIHRFYREWGPLRRGPTEAAFTSIGNQLGEGRPLKAYLQALAHRIQPQTPEVRR